MNDTTSTYAASSIKRHRRTRASISALKESIFDIVDESKTAMTVRQVFYRMVAVGKIDKTEAEYQGTIIRLLGIMRKDGTLPYHRIADNTRWQRRPQTFDSIQRAIEKTAMTYRRSLWSFSQVQVEVWLEKESLAGVIIEATEKWDVALMVCRGYPSTTFVHSAATAMKEDGRPTYIYYFGDHDPSGKDIPRSTEAKMREMVPGLDLVFHQVAVTEDQIVELNLPTRPTKKSDVRAKNFKGESVELDAIPAEILVEMVTDSIMSHINPESMAALLATEKEERESFTRFARQLRGEL